MIVFIVSFAIIGNVFGNYDADYRKSLSPLSHGVDDYHQGDDWWYDLGGHNSYASDYLYATSPYYSWFKNAQMQYDMFAPALHVGKINRGNFLNPELNLPADRAFGDPYHSDFHADEMRSGAFEYRPRGQKIVARKVDVDAGIAKRVGDIVRLPVPVFVKKDGTLLVSAPQENRANPHDACSIHSNPCSVFPAKTICSHFDDNLAECSGATNLKLRLSWIDPTEGDHSENDVDLGLIPTLNYDGSQCEDFVLVSGHPEAACGATMGADKKANFPNKANELAFLGTVDGTSRQDYSYAVLAIQPNSYYNLQQGRLQLTVFEEAKDGSYNAVQHITVPYGTTINKQGKTFYFFGCLRPYANRIELDFNGFYDVGQDIRNTGYTIGDSELCEKLRTMKH